MTTDIVIAEDTLAHKFDITDLGLQVYEPLSLDEWLTLGVNLFDKYNRIKWLIADWLAYGEREIGESVYQVIEDMYAKQTIYNYTSVAKNIPHAIRDKAIAFTTYQDLIPLSPDNRDIAISKLKSGEWKRKDVRQWKRELKGDTDTEQTITLQVRAFTIKDGILTVSFVAPDEAFQIAGYQAIVRKPAMSERLAG
jgi:hypothetical protein